MAFLVWYYSFWLIIGLSLLILGAHKLVTSSSKLAAYLHVPEWLIGVTILAFGTSLPELVVSVQAALAGQADLAVGNVIGSNIANMGIILSVVLCFSPLKNELQKQKLDVIWVLISSFVVVGFLVNGHLGRLEAIILLLGMAWYIKGIFSNLHEHQSVSAVVAWKNVITALLWCVLSGGSVIWGGHFLLHSATGIAQLFQVPEAVIGLSLVSLGTSLPELGITIAACLQKRSSLIFGNLIGSNLFNLLSVLGIAGLISPLATSGVSLRDFVAMIGIFILGLICCRFSARFKGLGIGLFLIYAVYLLILFSSTKL